MVRDSALQITTLHDLSRNNMKTDTVSEKPSLDALLDQNLHDLINATAFRFYAVYNKRGRAAMISQEDLAQQGFYGAMTAYQSFNMSVGYDNNIIPWFRSHAYPYIKNAMLTYCRKFSHPLSISEKAAREDWGALANVGIVYLDDVRDSGNVNDPTGSRDPMMEAPMGSGIDETAQDVDDYFLAGFSQLERDLVKDHLIDGFSLQEVSKRHQISKSRASEIIRGLKDRMRVRAEAYVKDD